MNSDMRIAKANVAYFMLQHLYFMTMAVYLRIGKEIIDAIEQGGSDPALLLKYIPCYQRLSIEDSLEFIDSALERIFGESEPYSLITFEGEILATPDGEAYIPDLLEFEIEDGPTIVLAEPAVYKFPHEVSTAHTLMCKVDFSLFKKKAKLKKFFLEAVWQDFEQLKKLFDEATKQEQYIILL